MWQLSNASCGELLVSALELPLVLAGTAKLASINWQTEALALSFVVCPREVYLQLGFLGVV